MNPDLEATRERLTEEFHKVWLEAKGESAHPNYFDYNVNQIMQIFSEVLDGGDTVHTPTTLDDVRKILKEDK